MNTCTHTHTNASSTSPRQTALVLGATGGIGGEVARQLRDAGWVVKALSRGGAPADGHGIEWITGDAMQREDVLRAATGCDVIVHAVNPPGYRRWAELVLPMLDNTIAAATAEGATILLPGTVYNYGPDAFPVISESSPQHPETRKGLIRVEMERRLQSAARTGSRVIIVRAGDFFGPKVGNSWFAQGLVKPGRPVRSIQSPGAAKVGHQWAYVPDVARTMLALLARRNEIEPYALFNMAGHWDADGTRMIDSIRRIASHASGRMPSIRAFPWWLTALAAPFNTTLRELGEMRYLWRSPVRMDNARLVAFLGEEPHTSLDEAVEATLAGLGCLEAPERKPAPDLGRATAKAALALTVCVVSSANPAPAEASGAATAE
jgi:nucleoside-diphosphate-sugar epimerase